MPASDPGARPAQAADVLFFFTTSPLWLSGLLLIGPPTLIAMAGPFVVRPFAGPVNVGPEALAAVLEDFGTAPPH